MTRVQRLPGYPYGELPDPTGVRRRHWLAGFAAESLLKFRHIAHYAVHAPLSGRVRIHADQHSRQFWSRVLAPDTAKAQEKALIGCVAVNFLVRILFGLRHEVMQRHQSYTCATVVCGIFTESQAA